MPSFMAELSMSLAQPILLPNSAQDPALAGLSLALILVSPTNPPPNHPGKVGKLEILHQSVYQS